MTPTSSDLSELSDDNTARFQIDSRREIIALLNNLKNTNQLVSMITNKGSEVTITAILSVDEDNDILILDSSATQGANEHLMQATPIFVESTLNKISIRFTLPKITNCSYKGKPALSCAIPRSLIRLQRRDYYRINMPMAHPVLCAIPIPEEYGGGTIKLPISDISCSGTAIFDEKKLLNDDFGTMYPNCMIELPDIGQVKVNLQVRNSQNLTLMNQKASRRIGFQFIGISQGIMSQIQKLITKIEREHNSRKTGLG